MATYRISVWTGPGAAGEIADRVNVLAGVLEQRATAGTERVHFDLRAADDVGAYLRAEDLLTYVGLRSYARPYGRPNGVQARKLSRNEL